jgi:signal transduction histidine kinase
MWCVLTIAIAMTAGAAAVRAESTTMPAAPDGVVETGVPSFVVLGSESLGLNTAPTDLHLLPDGRILVVSQREIAIGDGGRWETFRQAPGQDEFIHSQVAVGDDGRIYAGITGSIARIDLGEDSYWRFVPVLAIPNNDPYVHVVQFPDTWLWASGEAVMAWRPGQPVRIFGLSDVVEHTFAVGSKWFASNGSSGSLYQLHFGSNATLVSTADALASDIVTSSADYRPDQVLVGTARDGLRAFDGTSFVNAAVPKTLGPGHRINDICRIGTDSYAVAVDGTGIVFFGRGGRTIQVLSHTLDHRLARAHRLVYSRSGVLWVLLDNAVACVEFPAPISNFEPILASVVNYAKPLRHQGGLWVLADGGLMRGVYDADQCLERFEPDTPPGRFLWAANETEGRLFASNEEGIFIRAGTGWQQVAAGIINARVGVGRTKSDGRFFYVGRDEIGWIRESAGRYDVHRIPVKGLGEVYNAVDDSAGAVWLELGTSRVGRVDFGDEEPTVRFFGKEDGLGDGWTSIFAIDGILRYSTSSYLERFDTATQRFVEDKELVRRIPVLADCTGRPARDASGRLWFVHQGAVCFVDDKQNGENPPVGSLRLGFQPNEFDMESGGVIWMQGREHLIRFDPSMPRPQPPPLRAQITSVQLTATNRHLFTPGPTLPPLPYSDNSILVRFAATCSPFGSPVSFEVMIEGATDRWVPAGTVGSASFNRLKEGRYVFHVRPVVAGVPGEEARLAFTVRPPWFRTNLAWVTYITTAVCLVLLVAWFFSYLERREMIRLERLVAERTVELNATNAQLGRRVEEITEKTAALAASEERYRRLNTELETRVDQRTAELSATNANLKREIAERQRAEQEVERVHKQLLTASHQAGMAEMATGVLHNVGNVLNSVNVSAGLVTERLRASKVDGVARLARLLREQGDGLARFLTEDVRGRTVPAYLEQLAAYLEQERAEVGKELDGLILNVDHVKEIVAMQQSYARVAGVIETVPLADLVEDALKIHGGAYARHGIVLERDYEPLPPVSVNKHKVLQILVNLIQNSKYACEETNQPEKRVTIRIRASGPDRARIEVTDTGAGIAPENMTRIFSQGFTTRKGGHGFGLHSGALAAKELGGTLAVRSEGPGLGATFILELPLQAPSSDQNQS